MVEAYSWHSGARAIKCVWPVPVPLLPDELLSSWLVRVALAQGCDPLILTGELWPKWRMWCVDVDRGVNEERFELLSKCSGIDKQHLEGTSLHSIISTISVTHEKAAWLWLLTLGARNRRRHGGLQFCPLCLREDQYPYYRMQWRFAWHTVCEKHKIYLYDRCPHCSAPIQPHRSTMVNPCLVKCANCDLDLRHAAIILASTNECDMQNTADHVVSRQWGAYGDNRLDSYNWFVLIRYFMNLYQKSLRANNGKLKAFLQCFSLSDSEIQPNNTGLAFELLSVSQRSNLLCAAQRLLNAGGPYFAESAKQVGINKSTLCERDQIVPGCLLGAMDSLPEKRFTSRKTNLKHNYGPKSKMSVRIMLARLKRKYR